MKLPVIRVEWKPCWRVIPSRFLPIKLFERMTVPDGLKVIFELDVLINPWIRNYIGSIELVPLEDRINNLGTSAILAVFTHLNQNGNRFSDGTYGTFYSANDLGTVIAETRYHNERFMKATVQGHMGLDMRIYLVDFEVDLLEIRGQKAAQPFVYNNYYYTKDQHLA